VVKDLFGRSYVDIDPSGRRCMEKDLFGRSYVEKDPSGRS